MTIVTTLGLYDVLGRRGRPGEPGRTQRTYKRETIDNDAERLGTLMTGSLAQARGGSAADEEQPGLYAMLSRLSPQGSAPQRTIMTHAKETIDNDREDFGLGSLVGPVGTRTRLTLRQESIDRDVTAWSLPSR